MNVELFEHQEVTSTFLANTPRAFVTSDPGTGKTLASLAGFVRSNGTRLLVLCPLSIMEPSWGNDIRKFTDWSYIVAHGTKAKREAALKTNCRVVISNHDAVKWLAQHPEELRQFSHIVIDEFTAFKNRTAQRSKALRTLTSLIPHVWMLSGTPNSNTILDIWYPTFLLDGGERLGKQFFRFRSEACAPKQVGPMIQHVQWEDKPGIEVEVANRLKDITIRYQLEECIDMPENSVHTLELDMPSWLRKQYTQLEKQDYLETNSGVVTSIHAGARVKKLLQLLSGAVYNAEGEAIKVHDDRYRFIMDLIAEREQCVVAFNWKHEVAALKEWAEKYNFSYAVIDGNASRQAREEAVVKFQAGELKIIFAHPASAAHGLTLTAGTTTLWASPNYNAEQYSQFNHRIYRAGQTRKTETIRVAYRDSHEIAVYEKLDNKMVRMEDLLTMLQALSA